MDADEREAALAGVAEVEAALDAASALGVPPDAMRDARTNEAGEHGRGEPGPDGSAAERRDSREQSPECRDQRVSENS